MTASLSHHTELSAPLYLDNNATTPLLPAVWEAMTPYFLNVPGNPASAHQFGRQARVALEDARELTASLLNAHPDEVIFTSGATEANNLALFGQSGSLPGVLLSSPMEHPSVVEPLRRLAEVGYHVAYLPVDCAGQIEGAAFKEHLRSDLRLIAIQLANHETGTLQPIRDCVRQLKSIDANAPFHCDAVQAVGKIPIDFHDLGVTTLALSAHKFHGPKGIGALLARRGAKVTPQLYGGNQQRGRRPGTESTALAVGLATALQLAVRAQAHRWALVARLRGILLHQLRAEAAPIVVNGPEVGGIPHTLNLSFPGVKADALLMALDLNGVACSTGSACSSGSLLPSPILQAMGVGMERLDSAMRFSLSALLTETEVSEAARRIVEVARRLRRTDIPRRSNS